MGILDTIKSWGEPTEEEAFAWNMQNNTPWYQDYMARKNAVERNQFGDDIFGIQGMDQETEMQMQPLDGPVAPQDTPQLQPGTPFGQGDPNAAPQAAMQPMGDAMVEQITQDAIPGTGLFSALTRPIDKALLAQQKAMYLTGNPMLQEKAIENVMPMATEYMRDRTKAVQPKTFVGGEPGDPTKKRVYGYDGTTAIPLAHPYNASSQKIDIDVGNKLRTVDDEIQITERKNKAKNAMDYNNQALDGYYVANDTLRNIDRMEYLLNNGVQTGFGEEWTSTARRALEKAGALPEGSNAGTEELRTLMGQLVMQQVDQTKGSVTDKEMELFRLYTANMGNTPEGNKAILSFKRQKAERDLVIGRLVNRLRNGTTYMPEAAIRQQVFEYMEANPLYIPSVNEQQEDEKAGNTEKILTSDELDALSLEELSEYHKKVMSKKR